MKKSQSVKIPILLCLIFSQNFLLTQGRQPTMIRIGKEGNNTQPISAYFRSSALENKAEDGGHQSMKYRMVQVVGSRLPDCSHACEACSPCRRVIVGSPKCSIEITRAEACPLAYKCMCRGKTYPVPKG